MSLLMNNEYFYCYQCDKPIKKSEYKRRSLSDRSNFIKCMYCASDIYIHPRIDNLLDDWPFLLDSLNVLDDDYVYHFTDRSNLASIAKYGGIYSLQYMNTKKIEIKRPGGDNQSRELDAKKELQDYCRLSFIKNHPMLGACRNDGRITDPEILEIDSIVLLLKSTKFFDMNATDRLANPPYNRFVEFCDGYSERTKNSDKNLDYKFDQAEILVKQFIPIKLFSEESQKLVKEVIKT